MKTKNFILPAIALAALISTSAFAQELDYHEQEALAKQAELRTTLTQDLNQGAKQKYLDIALLKAQINEDLPVDLKKLKNEAKNSLAAKQISHLSQYDLMVLCIENNRNDILRTLIEAGFDPKIDLKLNLISLPAKAVENDNPEAFGLTFTFNNIERTAQVTDELESIDPSLVNKFFDFVKKCESKSIIVNTPRHGSEVNKKASTHHNFSGGAHVSKPLVKEPIIVENEYGEQIGTIYSDPRTNITVIDYSGNALSVASEAAMRIAPKRTETDKTMKALSEEEKAAMQEKDHQFSQKKERTFRRTLDSIKQRFKQQYTVPNK